MFDDYEYGSDEAAVGEPPAATSGPSTSGPWTSDERFGAASVVLAAASDLFASAGIDLAGVDLSLLQSDDPRVSPLAWLDPYRDDLTVNALIELCAVACRLEAWAGSVKARGALHLRRSYQAELERSAAERGCRPDPDLSLAASVAATEVGCATGHSLDQVERWVRLAQWLSQVPTAQADFVSGRLGWAKAAAFEDCAASYSAEVAEAVYRAERDRAMVRTSGQMRIRWNRALAKADPDVMRERAETAHAEREVRLLTRCAAPGAASLLLTGPAPLILTAKQRLDDIAHAVRAADPADPRTLDAIRLDAALDLLLHGPFGAAVPDSPGSTAAVPWVASRRPAVVVTVPLSVLTGAGQAPAILAGYGPIPAELAREVATDAVWRCAVIDDDPASPTHGALVALGRSTYTPHYVPGPHARRFITLRDGTCRFPGCQAQAATADLDHRIPHARGGPTCDCNLQSLCRRHHRLKHEGGITVRPGPADGAPGPVTSDGAPGPVTFDSATPARRDAITWTLPSGRRYTTDPEPPPF